MDRNSSLTRSFLPIIRSLSARRAWIEIFCQWYLVGYFGSLSARRAWIEIISVRGHGFWPRVALRKESVDRNLAGGHFIDLGQKSLSARRAWIEIISVRGHGFWPRWSLSARRAWIEIVDVVSVQHGCESLSARRAWIEIVHRGPHHFYLGVALRKESVDRNIRDLLPCGGVFSRSPQGERG